MADLKIKVTGLKKDFNENHVLKGIDIEVMAGEVVCVIGPSGSGKSTFLRCLNRLEDVTEGEILVDGESITDAKANVDAIRRHMPDGDRLVGKVSCGHRIGEAREALLA